MCSLLQIRGFPTIKIFRKGEEPEDYQGGRSRGDIITRALDLFSDNAPPPELLEVSVHLCFHQIRIGTEVVVVSHYFFLIK